MFPEHPPRGWAVIDNNVLILADADLTGDDAWDDCTDACIALLQEVARTRRLALDAGDEILEEYRHRGDKHRRDDGAQQSRRDFSGQPGPGDRFFVWAHQNQHVCCHLVELTPDEDRTWAEFPDTPGLAAFDRSDRKWVAVALGCTPPATIYNATDSDWRDAAPALRSAGVSAPVELCPSCLKPASLIGRSESGHRGRVGWDDDEMKMPPR